MFSIGFTPAVNKEGLSKLKFVGAEKKEGIKPKLDEYGNPVIDPETGEPEIINWSLINLKFDVMGMVKGQWQVVSVTCTEKYSSENLLGKTLNQMGFVPSEITKTTDDDGFDCIELTEDEDGFGSVEGDIVSEIVEFLEESKDKFFVGLVYKPTEGKRKNFWQIDVNTLKPYVKK